MMYKLIYLIFIILFNSNVFAKDIGKVAQDFPILEESFIEMIKKKLADIDIEKHQKEQEIIAKKRVENPDPIDDITRATQNRTFYYDPTYIVKEDIKLPCGKILHKAGTKVNPLEHMDLDRRIYFIDARYNDQIDWLVDSLEENSNANNNIQNRVILVGGSPLEIQEQLGINVYFDQFGEITSKFGIKASPAIAVQDGLKVKIEEILLEDV